ncbi:hypothetical protein PMG11_09186 [Penicillium brasilianum]|uniref:Tat pathway signal sequence n=1 Tax=Penicillium brasilianum TaxID=104259 RepID=A0A0F7U018_PENBI|nr:hypothetical protein PMG11_09186 [Penicillium brasilianum]
MNKFSFAPRNITWLWNGKPNPVYAHLDLEDGEEGVSRRDEVIRTPFSSSQRGSNLRQYSTVLFCLILVVGSLMASFYLGQRLAINEHQSVHLRSDLIWGEVPLRKVRWINDERFMKTDPTKGRFFSNKAGNWTVWDEIHRGSWIQLSPSESQGISGGLPLSLYSENGTWPNGKEGYVPSVLHQLHCVGMMNHWKIQLMDGIILDKETLGHMGHCVEFIRHAILCFGDTTLEKPADHSQFVHVDYESSEHLCRDWSYISAQFWDSSIDFVWGTEKPMTVFENVDAAKGNPQGPTITPDEMA